MVSRGEFNSSEHSPDAVQTRRTMTDPAYQTWLDHLFGHPDDQPEWYFAGGFEFVPISPRTLTASE